jgi:beta-xylosidase
MKFSYTNQESASMKTTSYVTFLALSLLATRVGAAEFPGGDVPSNIGVNIHFAGPASAYDPKNPDRDWIAFNRKMDLIQGAGMGMIRMDFAWAAIETTQGQYNFSEYDRLFNACADRGIRVMAVLCYANALYGKTNEPAYYGSDAFRKGFTNYVDAVTKHFAKLTDQYQAQHPGSNVKMSWELWNEPNNDQPRFPFWPGSDANQYMALANQVLPVIRRNDPNATIVAPSLSAVTNIKGVVDWNTYLTTCLNYGKTHPGRQGLLSMVDGLSVHPYRWCDGSNPETAVSGSSSFPFSYVGLRSMMDSCGGSNVKIVSGEWGYNTMTGGSGLTLQTQADYAARMMLINFSQGIPYSIWYDFQNDGTDPKDGEHNFGLLNNDLTPKPAYHAIKKLTNALKSATFYARLDDGNPNDWLLVFHAPTTEGQKEILAAWTTGENTTCSNYPQWGTFTMTHTPVYLQRPMDVRK